MTRALSLLFALLFLGHALFGCAHVTPVVKACAPTASQLAVGVAAFTPDTFEVQVAALITTYGLCVVEGIADQILAGSLQLASPVGDEPPLVAHARAWRAAHP